MMMDESTYQTLVGKTFRSIEDAFADVDPDLVELSSTGDVLTLTFASGVRCVLNTQRPVRQIWMAAKDQAWHFGYDEGTQRWLDDRGRGLDLRQVVKDIVWQHAAIEAGL